METVQGPGSAHALAEGCRGRGQVEGTQHRGTRAFLPLRVKPAPGNGLSSQQPGFWSLVAHLPPSTRTLLWPRAVCSCRAFALTVPNSATQNRCILRTGPCQGHHPCTLSGPHSGER